jgi:hypothetical protein
VIGINGGLLGVKTGEDGSSDQGVCLAMEDSHGATKRKGGSESIVVSDNGKSSEGVGREV